MIRAVLDINVLLSGIVGVERETSTPGALVRAWRANRFELVISEHIRSGVQRNLTEEPYFSGRLSPEEVATNLTSLAVDATQAVVTVQVVGVATHPEDDLVLSAAVSAGVDYLVTGDHGLQGVGRYQGVRIVSPRAFLDILTEDAETT
ncbi:MAG: PIN domain-containing protein [Thermomicrobiales bacterium]